LSAFARLKQPKLPFAARGEQSSTPTNGEVYLGGAGGWIDAKIYNRDALEPGFMDSGPR
jgi:hypothetical protein